MIVGLADGAEYRLLMARDELDKAGMLVYPAYRDFSMLDRDRASRLIASAVGHIRAAEAEIGKLRRDHMHAPSFPRRCVNCERFYVERVIYADRCSDCFCSPNWPFKPELCELIHPGFQPLERK